VVLANTRGQATPFVCEQTDFSSVVACADAVQANGKPIDILICNAGINNVETSELVNGVDKTLAVNHLSHFILVNRLLQLVKAAPKGRIVTVGSNAYKSAPAAGIDFDNLANQHGYNSWSMYAQSKLANGLFARELAHRLCGTNVTSNVVHPGYVDTNMYRDSMRKITEEKLPLHLRVYRWFLLKTDHSYIKTPQQGAATTCYVATNPGLKKVSGQYFEDCNLVIPGGNMQNDAMARKLWDVSEDLTRSYL
jgi:NAD(P)-dependent dehydrogenase (short-subunit alcohol dehydrogenase family)